MNGKWTVENFKKFDNEHPEVYAMFKRLALQASQKRTRYSARGIFHVLRWETMINFGDDYKIDDGWSSHYARKFMDEYPKLEGFFETRVRLNSYHKKHDKFELEQEEDGV